LLTKIIGDVTKKYQFNTITSGKKEATQKKMAAFVVNSLDSYDVCNFILVYFVFSTILILTNLQTNRFCFDRNSAMLKRNLAIVTKNLLAATFNSKLIEEGFIIRFSLFSFKRKGDFWLKI